MIKNLLSIFRLGWLRVFLALALMIGIGAYISDSLGFQFGMLGVFIWGGAALFAGAFGLIYFAQFITPTAGEDGWQEGLKLLFQSLSITYPDTQNTSNKNNKRQRRQRSKSVKAPASGQLPPSFKTLKAGILRTHQVISTVYKGKYSGAKGPGFVHLREKELVKKLVDLRTQFRRDGNVRVTTRDGIQLVASVSVLFKIKGAPAQHEDILFPFDKNAIFQVTYADAIDDHGDIVYWQETLVPQAITYAIQEVGKYTLNQLTSMNNGVTTLSDINQVIQQEMERKFEGRGVDILSASMSNPRLPEEIQDQRLASWQTEWSEKTKLYYADSEVEVLQQRKEVRARAQIKIIDAISRNLNLMQRDDDSEMVGLITLRMIEALEEAVSEGSVNARVPQTIMANLIEETSAQMRAESKQSRPKPPPSPDPTPTEEDPPDQPQPPQNNMRLLDEDET